MAAREKEDIEDNPILVNDLGPDHIGGEKIGIQGIEEDNIIDPEVEVKVIQVKKDAATKEEH